MIEYWQNIEFLYPHRLWWLIILPLIYLYHFYNKYRLVPQISLPTMKILQKRQKKPPVYIKYLSLPIKLFALGLFIIALARPQSTMRWSNTTTEGIDIIIALDISGSMLARDFKPNRLEVAKEVAIEFIKERPNDRIGLVLFSGEAFTQCPLTTDHQALIQLFKEVQNGMIEDGTAIGLGLATAVNRLKNSDAKSKVVILLTDGFNTGGSIPPLTAAEIAAAMGVRVYTIGIGTNGLAPMPYKTPYGTIEYQMTEVRIDEPTMKKIAEITNGKYFRATNKETLRKVYKEIDQLEKTRIEVSEYRQKSEEYSYWVLTGLGLLLLDFLWLKIFQKSAVL